MPLSDLDLDGILKIGYMLEYFAVKTEEGPCLRNSSGRCIFLQKESCIIYPNRPEGCRLYPLVYDGTLEEPMMDSICPYGYEFRARRNDIERLESLIGKIYSLEDHV